jgi:hypothetical protein
MAAQDLILVILIGGILGAVGQGIRVIVGLKKVYDKSLQKGVPFSENFNGASLMFSLLIGFIAGVLGMVSLDKLETLKIGKEQIITLIGIGYAGADFIEGFIKKNTSQFSSAQTGAAAKQMNDAEQPPVG